MATTRLRAVRHQLGYSADAVIKLVLSRASALGLAVMTATSLKTKLSRWENGHEAVSEPYQRLFRDVYGRTNEELGFPPELIDDEAEELRNRLIVARRVDAETVEVFRRQVNDVRHRDRRFGGVTLLDQLRSSIREVETTLRHGAAQGLREALAGVLTEASTLAGWESLDRNAVGQAWNHYERARAAAREADSPALLAHATAEQAFVLIDLGETGRAVEQLTEARTLAGRAVPPLLNAWLAAAHGEGLAAAGRRAEALRAFDAARALLPSDPVDPALPFLFLAGAHLDRWRGHALARLGEPDAITHLHEALPRLPVEFIRARTGMLVDLAFAYAAVGDRDAALDHSRQARRLGSQIKSDRQLRRLGRLVLPGGFRGVV
ncbi:tetratricopeptide repeat protein [Crossiella sp. CA198]|uniref:tetratricopeptide repeat protein n=1 Tax=Crossiella sp. CA198 TaxID=3455607 RepID=UPI003F8D3565